jgi:flavin reductase (DIM6/NTAB) family NADH-FMN oxidoreductase RutF
LTPELFKEIASRWLTGVAVVTATAGDGEPHGMTMSAVTSLSLDPPQFLCCMDRRARTLAAIAESRAFCIHFLNHDQQHISANFARPHPDRFAGIPYRLGHTGSPVLDGVIAFVECRLAEIHPGGDHSIVIGDAISGDVSGGDPLAYFHGHYHKLGDQALFQGRLGADQVAQILVVFVAGVLE